MYTIHWAESVWTLDQTTGRLGLRPDDGSSRRFLELKGLAAVGRRDDDAFNADSLTGIELFQSRILATYAPKGWHGLTIRAAWGPSCEGRGLDLEIQASTSSVGELEKLEILVGSSWDAGAAKPISTTVEPRDRRSGSLSYDGRETVDVLQRLTTSPIPGSEAAAFPPILTPANVVGGQSPYLEMVHPYDVSRRLVETVADGTAVPRTTAVRYALFGFDLEKGVVLRGRLRGLWLHDSATTSEEVAEHHHRFLHEPPPLGM